MVTNTGNNIPRQHTEDPMSKRHYIYKTLKQLCLLQAGVMCLFANTYYVSPSGSDRYAGTSAASPWKTVNRVENAPLTAGDTVLFQRDGVWRELLYMTANTLTFGAYGTGQRPVITGADLVSGNGGWTFIAANVWGIPLAAEPTQVWFNGARGTKMDSPQAVLGQTEWNYAGGRLSVYSAIDPGLSRVRIEASQRSCALSINGFSNETFRSIDFSAGNAVTVLVGPGLTGTQTFQDVVWENSPAEGLMALSGAIHITSSIGQNNLFGMGIYGGEGLLLSNSILSGNSDRAILIAGTSGPSFIESSTITGNATLNNAAHVISNVATQTLTASRSVLLPNPYLPALWNFSGLTDDGTNVYTSPAFTARSAPLIVVPYIDDINNLAVAESVAKVAESYGYHISFAVNTRPVGTADWPRLAALQAAGHDIVAHTRTHSDLANMNVLSIQYTGAAASATLTINVPAGRMQTFLSGSATPDLDIPLPVYYSAIDLCNYLSTREGYSCSMSPTEYWFDPVNLMDINNASITTAYTVQADPARFYPYEINGAKADIAANMPGYKATTFATPYSSSSYAIENLIQGAGFDLNRNGMPDTLVASSLMLSHIDLYTLAGELLGVAFDQANLRRSADSLVEGLGAAGGMVAVYAHGYDEFTLDQWNTFFSELKAIGATCMTASESVAYIKAHGSLAADGTARNWNVPMPLSPNYSASGSSPAQGAHLQVSVR